jgi:hypothetical protein
VLSSRPPLGAHVEQVHEEVVGERFWALREDAVLRLSEVRIQDAHAANQSSAASLGSRKPGEFQTAV